jgi:hypothetical protein
MNSQFQILNFERSKKSGAIPLTLAGSFFQISNFQFQIEPKNVGARHAVPLATKQNFRMILSPARKRCRKEPLQATAGFDLSASGVDL